MCILLCLVSFSLSLIIALRDDTSLGDLLVFIKLSCPVQMTYKNKQTKKKCELKDVLLLRAISTHYNSDVFNRTQTHAEKFPSPSKLKNIFIFHIRKFSSRKIKWFVTVLVRERAWNLNPEIRLSLRVLFSRDFYVFKNKRKIWVTESFWKLDNSTKI